MDSNKCCTYQIATGRITAIISWLGHRFKDTRLHRQERSPNRAQTRLSVQRGFSQIGSSSASQPRRPSLLSWLSSIGGGTLGSADLFIVRYPTVELWKDEVWRKKEKKKENPRIDGSPVWGREVSRCRGRDRASAARNLSKSGSRSTVGSPDCKSWWTSIRLLFEIHLVAVN